MPCKLKILNASPSFIAFCFVSTILASAVIFCSLIFKSLFLSSDAGDEKTFADKFKENLGASFRGNEEIYNEIFAGASAYYYKTLATVGDNEKAIQNTIKLFGNEGGIYSYVDINEQPVFIPPNVNGAQIKANVEDMLANPHKYAITSSNTFTLQDIVENKDEYTVVVEGGTAKLIQNSNVLFASEIYQKLPSGPNEYVYSDVLVSTDDGSLNNNAFCVFASFNNFWLSASVPNLLEFRSGAIAFTISILSL